MANEHIGSAFEIEVVAAVEQVSEVGEAMGDHFPEER